jgi:hypothetical protein
MMRKTLSISLSTALLVGTFATSAMAAYSRPMSTTGVYMNMQYTWEPAGTNNGAFHYWGKLDDTQNDGNAAQLKVGVAGYAYRTHQNSVDQDKTWDWRQWDPQAIRTNTAHSQVCRNRGILYPDNCSAVYNLRRP